MSQLTFSLSRYQFLHYFAGALFEVFITVHKVSDVSKDQLDANLKNRSEFCMNSWSTKGQIFNFQEKSKPKTICRLTPHAKGSIELLKLRLAGSDLSA